MVGCGAAAAIAGAFGAPLAGAFYAFELVIGGYTPASLAPVGVAAVTGYFVTHGFEALSLGISVGPVGSAGCKIGPSFYLFAHYIGNCNTYRSIITTPLQVDELCERIGISPCM